MMREAIFATLRAKRKKFYKSVPGALKFKDTEDLHELRVAGRTVLALVDLLAEPDRMASKRFTRMRRPLKRAMGLLGRLRDADVLIDEIGKRLPDMTPARRNTTEAWLELQKAERRKLQKKLARELPDVVDARWKKHMARWQRETESRPADESRLTDKIEALRASRGEAFRAIQELYPGPVSIDDEELLNRIHRGRIATKKLRYALEALESADGAHREEIRRLKKVQDQLGHVQDLRTWGRKLQSAGGDRRVVAAILKEWQGEIAETLRQTDLTADTERSTEVTS